ncbi:hypothetical protein BDD12DRAFT_2809 [Trichophaea hybrida]|nr:hypothetical protein BDD12DRAFT_2809 [Trichophaea hybrida]
MVTGIEAAGLALAIFPLVVKGYQDGAGMFADARKHQRVLKRLVRRLKMECVKFENTITDLLDGIVPANKLERLLKGEGWKENRFQQRLREKFKPKEVDIFTDAVEDLMEYIQQVGQGLGLDTNYKLCRSKWYNVWTALEKEEYNSSLDEIRRINSDLIRLTKQSAERPPPEQHNRLFAAKNYNKMRTRAKSLYSVLRGTFEAASCSCNHNASLLLEHCPTEYQFRFKVLFNLQSWPVDGWFLGNVGMEWNFSLLIVRETHHHQTQTYRSIRDYVERNRKRLHLGALDFADWVINLGLALGELTVPQYQE